MSSYNCPDCESPLIPRVRQLVLDPDAVIELAAGDAVYGIKGQPFVVSIECSNGCSSESDDDSHGPPPEECGVNECARPKGHEGRHRRKNGGGS
jgi:hypothetical protein